MLPLRARAMQHDDEVDSSATATLQLPQAQLSLPQVDDPSPPPRPPQAKQMVPGRILPHPDTIYPLISPFTQRLVGHIQNAWNTLPEPRVSRPNGSSGIQPQCPNVKHQVPAGLPTSTFALGLFSLSLMRLLPPTPLRLGQSLHLSLVTSRSTTTPRIGTLD